MITTEQIKELERRREALHRHLAIEDKIIELDEEQSKTLAPDFWDKPEEAEKQLKKVAGIKSWIDDYNAICRLCDDLELMPDFVREGGATEEELDALYAETVEKIEALEMRNMLRGEEDKMGAIMDINSGAGGTESLDWASMLLRMYTRWGERNGYKVRVADMQAGEEVGVKSATLEFEGDYAYGFLKSENGVHRLVRISPFDANARRQTSFSAVEVMPEIEDDTSVEIRPEDIEMQVFRSSGAGGQHINKTSSAVRLIHKPTGIVVSCQTERSQFQNRDTCMKMLRSRLVELKMQQHAEKISDLKGVQLKIEWGSQIRSYVFMPYQLVKDNRTGYETSNINAVMDGDLDGFINAYLKAEATGNWAEK